MAPERESLRPIYLYGYGNSTIGFELFRESLIVYSRCLEWMEPFEEHIISPYADLASLIVLREASSLIDGYGSSAEESLNHHSRNARTSVSSHIM